MSTYTFSTSSGFATNGNITLINTDIDNIINTRTDTVIEGDTIKVTFSSPLSDANISNVNTIFKLRDNVVLRGDKIIILYPYATIKTPLFHICSFISYKKWNITNVEVSSYMDSSITDYTVRLYDPTNNNVICSSTLTNVNEMITDLGSISNLPQNDTQLEVQVKVTGGTGKVYAYINSIIIYYTL
jgi:hypothetical protein